MSRVDLEELKRLDAEATPGPWYDEACSGDSYRVGNIDKDVAWLNRWPDASLVAELRSALPQIIRELEAGRALAESVREWSRKKITRDYHPMEQCLDRYDAYTKGEG